MLFPHLLLAAAAAAAPEMLVSTDWVAKQSAAGSDLVILHAGGDKEYLAEHIPGARLVKLQDISVPGAGEILLELPPVEELRRTLAGLGISNDSRVVIYAGMPPVQTATRVWFTLDYLGIRASLMNGGIAAWKAEGRAVTTEVPPPAKAGQLSVTARVDALATAEWLKERLGDKSVAVVDARLPQFYSGAEPGMASRAGHIPGAVNVPFPTLVGEHGKLRPREELGKLLPAGRTIVSYCHIGQQATVVYFAARYLGLPVKLYDGSFREWTGRNGYPVE
jgi:thiosulfate/3-mercaptopyruvate sulfurtransferase